MDETSPTNEQESAKPWFEFRIEETEGRGVELPKLTRLLQDLSSTFYALARAKLGKPNRPGPHGADEEAIAAIRLLRIRPGSTIIEAEPPISGLQGQLQHINDQATADDIAYDFIQEMQRIIDKEHRSIRAQKFGVV